MVILTPIENVVLLNLEFNTHLNISKLLSSSLLCYKTNDLFFVFNIPINMYSKDQKCGTSDLKCQWNLDRYGTFQMCLVMFTNVFFCFVFLYIYLMHWSDPRRHLCCLDTQYVMVAGKLFFFFSFFLSFVFVHVHRVVSPRPSCIFRTESLAFTHILHTCFKSPCSHQIKILMARHPFKNPLKALVTFQATCF